MVHGVTKSQTRLSDFTYFLFFTHIYIRTYVHIYVYIWASQVAQLVKNTTASVGDARDPGSILGSG